MLIAALDGGLVSSGMRTRLHFPIWIPPTCPWGQMIGLSGLHTLTISAQVPVPFFLEVHEEISRLWLTPLSHHNRSGVMPLWLLHKRTTLQPLRTSSRGSMLPLHVATRPPSSPLEPKASEVASCNVYSRPAQLCRRPWHKTGLGAYASMSFSQFLHKHCAKSWRMKSRSCWLCFTSPPGPGFLTLCSWQQSNPPCWIPLSKDLIFMEHHMAPSRT